MEQCNFLGSTSLGDPLSSTSIHSKLKFLWLSFLPLVGDFWSTFEAHNPQGTPAYNVLHLHSTPMPAQLLSAVSTAQTLADHWPCDTSFPPPLLLGLLWGISCWCSGHYFLSFLGLQQHISLLSKIQEPPCLFSAEEGKCLTHIQTAI